MRGCSERIAQVTAAPAPAAATDSRRTGTAPAGTVGDDRDHDRARAPRAVARPTRPAPTAPRWPRVALTALLAATAVLYLWGLSRSGWANAFYSAAAQAGGESWKAWFFGSSDAANAITVDKTPAALWVTGLSVRIFGLSSWSVLVPQALMGVASVGLLYAAVKRVAGPGAGLIAGAALALTPVAVLIFRFNNPDALLVLVLIGAAYATQRAVEKGGTRWLVLAGVLVGVGFLAKMLQAFLVLPALTAVWLLAAPVGWWRRIRDLLLAGRRDAGQRGLVGARRRAVARRLAPLHRRLADQQRAGARVRLQRLRPADRRRDRQRRRRPRRRLGADGHHAAVRLRDGRRGVVAAAGRAGAARRAAVARPARGSAHRLVPPTRRARVLWGGWLLVTGLVFSYMAGIIHPYYTVAIAPAVAALVGLGRHAAVARPGDASASRVTLAVVLALTVGWAWYLLAQTTWQPWLTWAVPLVGLVGVAGAARRAPDAARRGRRRRDGRAGRRGGRLDRVRAGHGGDPAHRRDPVGGPGGLRAACGGPGGMRGGAAGRFRAAGSAGSAAASAGRRRTPEHRAATAAPAVPAARGPGGGGRHPRLPHPQRRAHRPPRAGRRLLHLGRRRRRLQQRRRLPARRRARR